VTASLLLVCTGNVARSVMARCMLEWLAETEGIPLQLTTAGTHAVEGQPAGARTLAALGTIGVLGGVPGGALGSTPLGIGRHRSHQLAADDVGHADLVVVMEAAHVRYVRRHFPGAAGRTATLRHLCRELAPGPPRLAARVAALDLAAAVLDDTDDVLDPAGGDDAAYASCASQLWALCTQFVTRL
jgi:protein-tyrosine-phosphatase